MGWERDNMSELGQGVRQVEDDVSTCLMHHCTLPYRAAS